MKVSSASILLLLLVSANASAVPEPLPEPSPVPVTFRDGEQPWAGYAGTRDVVLSNNDDPRDLVDGNTNYNSQSELRMDGMPDQAMLLRFDLSSIPVSTDVTLVTAATLTFTVIEGSSADTYELYELLRPWDPGTATWFKAKGATSWFVPGAQGLGKDRGSDELATPLTGSMNGGPVTLTFTTAGLAAIDKWLASPSTNFGFAVMDYRNRNAVAVGGCNFLDTFSRPVLEFTTKSVTQGGTLVTTHTFQHGVSPSTTYAGCTDTVLAYKAPVSGNWNGSGLEVSGTLPAHAGFYLSFDLSALPKGTVVKGGSLLFRVTDGTTGPVPVFRALRPWEEAKATWLTADTTPWEVPGGDGATDHTLDAITSLTAPEGPLFVLLNAESLALVQSWVDGTNPNLGFAVVNHTLTDAFAVADSEDVEVAARPGLSLSVVFPDGGGLLIPGATFDGGVPDAGVADGGVPGVGDAGTPDAGPRQVVVDVDIGEAEKVVRGSTVVVTLSLREAAGAQGPVELTLATENLEAVGGPEANGAPLERALTGEYLVPAALLNGTPVTATYRVVGPLHGEAVVVARAVNLAPAVEGSDRAEIRGLSFETGCAALPGAGASGVMLLALLLRVRTARKPRPRR